MLEFIINSKMPIKIFKIEQNNITVTQNDLNKWKYFNRLIKDQLKQIAYHNIENDRLIINDFEILSELTTFVANKRGTSYEAEDGRNDDLAMCLVFFAWLSQQDYFKELTDIDIRKNLYKLNEQALEDELVPFGFIEDGQSGYQEDDEFKGGELVKSWDYDYDRDQTF